MTSIKLMLNGQRVLKNGKYPLVFQVIHNRRKRLMYTGIRLYKEEFDSTASKVKVSDYGSYTHLERRKMNNELKQLYKQILSRVKDLEGSGENFTVDDVVDWERKTGNSFDFIQYAELQISRKRKIGKEGIAEAYRSTCASLKRYIETFPGKVQDVQILDIDYRFVLGYKDFLYMQGVSENTVNYYLRNFRTIYNAAANEGYKVSKDNPFTHIHTKVCRTVKRALGKESMKRLLLLQLSDCPDLEFVRDLYLFSFYAQGMSFVDIVFLEKKSISNGLLIYSRHKSKQLIYIVITPQMQDLMNKYSNDSEYVFPIIDVSDNKMSLYKQYRSALCRVNRYLKRISIELDIEIPLTTYTARHTWATLARDTGAPLSVISAALGHTSEEMTRIYLKDFDQNTLAKVNSLVTNLVSDKAFI